MEVENAYKQPNVSITETVKSIFNKKKMETIKKAYCFSELKSNNDNKMMSNKSY